MTNRSGFPVGRSLGCFALVSAVVAHLLGILPMSAQAADTPHQEGMAAGRAANPVARATVVGTSAGQVVPNYGTNPTELRLYHQPDLSGQARQHLAQCGAQADDPTCQAQRGASQSALTPRPAVLPDDPAVAGARAVQRNPSQTLGSLSDFYSGCTTTVTQRPEGHTQRQCLRTADHSSHQCLRTLTVFTERQDSCTAGQWYAEASTGQTRLAVQCLTDRPASQQHLRAQHNGVAVAFFDTNMDAPVRHPELVAVFGTNFSFDGGAPIQTGLWLTERSCQGDACSASAVVADEARASCWGNGESGLQCTRIEPFSATRSTCPTGTQQGDRIEQRSCQGDSGCSTTALDGARCFAPSAQPTALAGYDITGNLNSFYWVDAGARTVTGWAPNPAYGPMPSLRLAYTRATARVTETDHWSDTCDGLPESLTPGSRCTPVGAAMCTDGPAARQVNGTAITRDCWATTQPLACSGTATDDACGLLTRAGCILERSRCLRSDADTGLCLRTEETHRCPTPAEAITSAANCPQDVACIGENCFSMAAANDPDFARSMSYLEAGRQAGVYLDADRMRVFHGEQSRCRDRLLKDCCDSDRAGAGMSNLGVFGVGSRLVFDLLMNADNRDFVRQGLAALLNGAGFNGIYSTFGVTVAVNGTALPTGSAVLHAGDSMVIAFDPWSLAIGAVFYIALEFASCNADEGKLAMKEGARLCHTVGNWCSSCLRILGACVSCIEHTTSKCCFNSVLARLINAQGRQQLGKTWGPVRQPDCSGFSIDELQRLNFAAMDLSEFYASLVPTLPAAGRLQQGAADRLPTCYLGQGRCQ